MPCELTKHIETASIEAEFQYRIDLFKALNADEKFIEGFVAAVRLFEDLKFKDEQDANS